MTTQGERIVEELKQALSRRYPAYEAKIDEWGQVRRAEQRASGWRASETEHVEALMLAQLSGGRQWRKVDAARNDLRGILCGYNADQLARRSSDAPAEIANAIRALIGSTENQDTTLDQVLSIPNNIASLRRLGTGTCPAESFLEGKDPIDAVIALGCRSALNTKLERVGVAIAAEYLKGVGVDVAKPDRHVMRWLAKVGRIVWDESDTSDEAKVWGMREMQRIAREAGCAVIYLDGLVFLLHAHGYGGGSTARRFSSSGTV